MKTFIESLRKKTIKRIFKIVDTVGVFVAVVWISAVALNSLDTHLAPVVEDFEVSSVEPVGDSTISLYGTMDKVRNCSQKGLSAYYDPSEDSERPFAVPMTYPGSAVDNRPAIEQSWGPWEVNLKRVEGDTSEGSVDLYVDHSCHIFWNTSTHLTNIPLEGLE